MVIISTAPCPTILRDLRPLRHEAEELTPQSDNALVDDTTVAFSGTALRHPSIISPAMAPVCARTRASAAMRIGDIAN